MDQFYLRNAIQYQALVDAFKPMYLTGALNSSDATSPDMVVSARIRPLLGDDMVAGFPCAVFPRHSQPGVLDIHDLYNHPRGRPILKSFNYQVDKLFTPDTTTEEIYQDLLIGLVPFARQGGIGTIFAYGQTGSGKTFTISRLEQLVMESLTISIPEEEKDESQPHIRLTIIELAGNSAFDLLSARKPISILEDASGTTQLSGAAEHQIHTIGDALSLIDRAASLRKTASTMKNDTSSRSHSICRIRIANPSANTEGFLYLVDLAGSEAARDVATHGAERMRETKDINLSLSVLKDCIRGRAEWDVQVKSGAKGKKPRMPFRQSALTKVLKHVFDTTAGGRECKTAVIACVNPSLADVGASKNTLRYAEMLRVLMPRVGKNEGEGYGVFEWGNGEVREWIIQNCGTPPISPNILAPTESGAEILRLSALEFDYRCLKNPGVTREQTEALRSKLWQLHIDSQRQSTTATPALSSTGTDSSMSTAHELA
ncbi:P-loop containing nucleoside triphosphate hydrolase protein [Lasiosphaeris hirsuta]|uniref:P-loop containing nucleoside triphosphate hydrolase protein n=1 Tax=Lasiosphaeris hirsuta TaxID=260670 RepID=A0AA40AIC4_9PEZI|nr:P-loop containing nucleoside triphosphate hydrolase protein [Lasiosphaeris hirsuta]